MGEYERLHQRFMSYFIDGKRAPIGLRILHITYQTPQPLKTGSIIDVETTGLDPNNDIIITCGILTGNQARVHQLLKPEYHAQFKSFLRERIKESQTPRYAYNTEFEEKFLDIHEGWQDLTQYAERTSRFDGDYPYYKMRLDQCTVNPFSQLDIKGAEVPIKWQEWLITHDPNTLWQITYHCLCDLLRIRQLIKE